MAFSYVLYTANGTNRNFSFSFPYLDASHIKVSIDGVETSAFSLLNSNTVQLNTAPPQGAIVKVFRKTPQASVPVDFTDGSILLERDLDLLATFNLYVGQEATDTAEASIYLNPLGEWEGQNLRLANLADPVNPQDAATMLWVEEKTAADVAAAAASATASANSAAASLSSANAASSSASLASAKAADAANSATAAATSATAAAASASTASTKASDATTSANNAATSATNAANSATAASNSATTAISKAADASGSASAAATSATNAANSATSAATSATNAANSATSAASSASSAAASLSSFRGVYYGAYSSAPTQDPNGGALGIGDLYFDTTIGAMKVYGAGGWQNAGSSVNGTSKRFRFTATAARTSFSGNDDNGNTLSYDPGFIDVYLNGIRLDQSDYVATNGTSITLNQAAASGAELNVVAFGTFSLANALMLSGGTMLGQIVLAGDGVAPLNPATKQQLDAAMPSGAVMAFARNTAPTGWLKCNGAAVSRTTYAALFAAIGTTFGAGDGSTTFNLPDLRGEFVRGWDDSRGVDSGRTFGSAQSSQNLIHSHTITDPGHNHYIPGGSGTGSYGSYHDSTSSAYAPDSSYTNSNTTGITINADGGSEARPRNIALLYCIKF